MKAIDITGLRFGKLIALKPTEKRCNGQVYWLCQCDCGKQAKVLKSALMNNNRPTKSCGFRVNA